MCGRAVELFWWSEEFVARGADRMQVIDPHKHEARPEGVEEFSAISDS